MEPDRAPDPSPPAPDPPPGWPRRMEIVLTIVIALGAAAASPLFPQQWNPYFPLLMFFGLGSVLAFALAGAWRAAEKLNYRACRQRLPLLLAYWFGSLASVFAIMLLVLAIHHFANRDYPAGPLLLVGALACLLLALRMWSAIRRARRLQPKIWNAPPARLTMWDDLRQSRPSLKEFMMTGWVGILLLAALRLSTRAEPEVLAVAGIGFFLIAALGNLWAWSTAQRLGLGDLPRRLGLMLLGALAMPAFSGTLILGVGGCFTIWFSAEEDVLETWLTLFLLFLPCLVVSAAVLILDREGKVAVTRRCRRRRV